MSDDKSTKESTEPNARGRVASRLYDSRTVLVFGEINMALAERVSAQRRAIYAEATGQSIEKIARDTDRNHWLNAQEAVAYGLVGRIVNSAAELTTS
jgi:ATP-dependent protease ClpP protease subunit